MQKSRWARAAAVAVLALGLSLPGHAGAVEPVQQHNSNAVWFENWIGLSNATLRVAAPNGKLTQVFANSGTPVFTLDPAETIDGVYRFELSAATEERAETVNPTNDGRGDAAATTQAVPFYMTGRFVVSQGIIITPEATQEEN